MSDLPELRFLDDAATMAGCGSWQVVLSQASVDPSIYTSVICHAKTLQKLAELEAENAWRPIEDAPKRGEYLVYQPETKSGRSLLSDRICLSSQAGHIRRSTHFRPLPSPPKGDVACPQN